MTDQESSSTVYIGRQFTGPRFAANGGYVAGLIAAALERPVTVNIHAPVPIGRRLRLTVAQGVAHLTDTEQVLASASRADPVDKIPKPVTSKEATRAAENHPVLDPADHPFPTCFVCGTDRTKGGLGLLPGRVPDRNLVAAPWLPDPSMSDWTRHVAAHYLWAGLDCPSVYAELGSQELALLVSMTGHVVNQPRIGTPLVVIGWSRGRSGRKLFGGSAIYGPDGDVIAAAETTWITVDDAKLRRLASSVDRDTGSEEAA